MEQIIDFENLAGGALKEKLNQEVKKVLENITDPNTKETETRKLTLNISFKPSKERDLAEISIETKSKLAAAIPSTTKIIIDKDFSTGKVAAAEWNNQIPGQIAIDVQEEKDVKEENKNKVVDLRA